MTPKVRSIYSGINIQFPISRLIWEGSKTIETRTYPIPKKYIGQTLLLIETPGKKREFKTRIIAKIVFGQSFKYPNINAFYRDVDRHRVTSDSPWRWTKKAKWGWPITSMEKLKTPIPLNRKPGIVFSCGIEL